ncbi:MAG: helix-turn-helix transcriptional regulator [Cyanobacteria bacterium P01_F01_bin.56]
MSLRTDRTVIGRNMRLRRQDLELSQTEVAKQIGLNRKTLGEIEKGRSSLPLESAVIAVEILKFKSLSTLFIPLWE